MSVELDLSLSIGLSTLCRRLRRFIGQEVTLRTRSGDVIQGTLRRVTFDGLVSVLESAMVSPFMEAVVTVISCEDIESFSFSPTTTTL